MIHKSWSMMTNKRVHKRKIALEPLCIATIGQCLFNQQAFSSFRNNLNMSSVWNYNDPPSRQRIHNGVCGSLHDLFIKIVYTVRANSTVTIFTLCEHRQNLNSSIIDQRLVYQIAKRCISLTPPEGLSAGSCPRLCTDCVRIRDRSPSGYFPDRWPLLANVA